MLFRLPETDRLLCEATLKRSVRGGLASTSEVDVESQACRPRLSLRAAGRSVAPLDICPLQQPNDRRFVNGFRREVNVSFISGLHQFCSSCKQDIVENKRVCVEVQQKVASLIDIFLALYAAPLAKLRLGKVKANAFVGGMDDA